MRVRDLLSLRWLKRQEKWPEPKKREIHTRHLKRFSLPEDNKIRVLEAKWKRDAEDANRAAFPSRRQRLQAVGLWKWPPTRAERKRNRKKTFFFHLHFQAENYLKDLERIQEHLTVGKVILT